MGHLKEIDYYIFQFKDLQSPGVSIYEYEAEIRKEYPTAIMFVYSKDMYLYDLNCDSQSSHDKFVDILSSKKIGVEMLSKGSFHSKTTFTLLKQSNKALPLVYMNFLKAVKKFIVWKLTEQRGSNGLLQVIPFGNHAISTTATLLESRLILIDPLYNFNNELLINICTKNQGLQRMSSDMSNFTSKEYALYLAPSAVRVYLANEDLNKSLLDAPPLNHLKLLKLLKDFGNVDLYFVKDLKWVKVIPDLGHLNYLTPNLSQYLKNFNNGLKYLVWPLALCFRQEGFLDISAEFTKDLEFEASSFGHIFNIIEEFIEFNNEVEADRKKESECMSSMNTPASVTTGTPLANQELADVNFGITTTIGALPLPTTEEAHNDNYEPVKSDEEDVFMDDKWDTELFGGEDEDENDQVMNDGVEVPNENNNNNNKNNNNNEADPTEDYFLDSLIDENLNKLFPDTTDVDELASTTTKNLDIKADLQEYPVSLPLDKNQSNQTFIDTSKFIKGAGTDNSFYEDPGAPAPIPFAIIAENSQNEEDNMLESSKKSVFAPLKFNPAIEQSIDSKYLNGGKFYVPPDIDSESNFNETLDSSIKCYTPVTPSLRNGTFQSKNVVSSSEDSDSSSDENDKEEDEDEDFGPNDSTTYEKNEEKQGLGIVQFKKDDLTNEDDKLNDLALSSPSRKGELTLPSNFVSSMSANSVTKSDSSSTPSPSAASSENQNWLPFVLKQIPLYTLPTAFLNKNNPTISKNELENVIPILIKLFVFDSFNDNRQITDREQKNLACLKFDCCSTKRFDSEICDLMEKSFPGVSRTSLYEMVKQMNEADNSMRENFECLTGSDVREHSTIESLEMSKNDFMDSTSPFMNSSLGYNFYDSLNGISNMTPSSSSTSEIAKNLFQISQPRICLNRLDKEIKLNYSSLGFWNFLNLQPAGLGKDFDVLFVTLKFGSSINQDHTFFEKSVGFLDSIGEYYRTSRLGLITRYDKTMLEESRVLNNISVTCKLDNGVYEIACEEDIDDDDMWKIIDEKLINLTNFMKSQIEDNNNELRPLMVLVANPCSTYRSIIEIGKVLANFDKNLNSSEIVQVDKETENNNKKKKRKISITRVKNYKILFKILSLDIYYSSEQTYTILSNTTINRIALDLYNICPLSTTKTDESITTEATATVCSSSLMDQPYTTISPGVPEKISYLLTKASVTKSVNSRDVYIHLAYERSIDKNWCVASWSDQFGNLTNVKAWYCPHPPLGTKETTPPQTTQQQQQQQSKHQSQQQQQQYKDAKSFEEVCNEIWEITLNYIRSYTGKSYLVLTRLNNIIPDDELVHWKRLSVKTKNLLLIVLTVNLNSNLVLDSIDSQYFSSSSTMMSPLNQQGRDNNNNKKFKNEPDSVMSNTGLTPFLVGNGDSPELYMTGGVATPIDINSPNNVTNSQSKIFNNTEDVSITDMNDDAYGIILPFPVPLSNQQIRVSIKTGFLIRASLQHDQNTLNNNNNNSVGKDDGFTPVSHPFQQPSKRQQQQQQQQQQQNQQQQQQQHNPQQKQELHQGEKGQERDKNQGQDQQNSHQGQIIPEIKLKIEDDTHNEQQQQQYQVDLNENSSNVMGDDSKQDEKLYNNEEEGVDSELKKNLMNSSDHLSLLSIQPNNHQQQNSKKQQQQQQQRPRQQQQQQSHTKFIIRSNNILEVNLMSCPSFINAADLMKDLLHQYRDLSSLSDCWGMNGENNLQMLREEEEELMMVPWHILSVRKCLNALQHINVVD